MYKFTKSNNNLSYKKEDNQRIIEMRLNSNSKYVFSSFSDNKEYNNNKDISDLSFDENDDKGKRLSFIEEIKDRWNIIIEIPLVEGKTNNPYFFEWKEHIEECLKNRINQNSQRYESDIEKSLLFECISHSKKNNTNLNNPSSIVLVHPFYLFLSGQNFLKYPNTISDADNYLKSLKKLINNVNRDKYDIILLDTIHHYASTSSLLLEKNLVSKVVFTEFDNGLPLEKKDVKDLFSKKNYFAGSYNYLCFSDSLEFFYNHVFYNDIFVIPDSIINSPLEYKKRIKPKFISAKRYGNVPSSKYVSIERLISDNKIKN
jgi:hypothetical protein